MTCIDGLVEFEWGTAKDLGPHEPVDPKPDPYRGMGPWVMRIRDAGDRRPNMTLHQSKPTRFKWCRPDGTVLKTQVGGSQIPVAVILYEPDVPSQPYPPPYDLFWQQGGEWQCLYEIRLGPNGAIDVNPGPVVREWQGHESSVSSDLETP